MLIPQFPIAGLAMIEGFDRGCQTGVDVNSGRTDLTDPGIDSEDFTAVGSRVPLRVVAFSTPEIT